MLFTAYSQGKVAALSKFALSAQELAGMGDASHAAIKNRMAQNPGYQHPSQSSDPFGDATHQQMAMDLHQAHNTGTQQYPGGSPQQMGMGQTQTRPGLPPHAATRVSRAPGTVTDGLTQEKGNTMTVQQPRPLASSPGPNPLFAASSRPVQPRPPMQNSMGHAPQPPIRFGKQR